MRHIRNLFVAAWCVSVSVAFAQSTRPHNFARWEREIAAYEAKDEKNPPAKGGVVFTGASSIRMWTTIPEDFPGANAINRGFGGSQMIDAVHFADRIVLPYDPRMVLIRAGGNDLHAGRKVEEVLEDFKTFVGKVRGKLRQCEVVYVSQSAAPARWEEREAVKRLNDMVKDWVAKTPGTKYVETWDLVMREDGTAREELFLKDKLHFTPEGNRLMAERVRPVVMGK